MKIYTGLVPQTYKTLPTFEATVPTQSSYMEVTIVTEEPVTRYHNFSFTKHLNNVQQSYTFFIEKLLIIINNIYTNKLMHINKRRRPITQPSLLSIISSQGYKKIHAHLS